MKLTTSWLDYVELLYCTVPVQYAGQIQNKIKNHDDLSRQEHYRTHRRRLVRGHTVATGTVRYSTVQYIPLDLVQILQERHFYEISFIRAINYLFNIEEILVSFCPHFF